MERLLRRIGEKSANPGAAPVLVAALGDSVTQGCFEEGRMDADAVYHRRLQRFLEIWFPAVTFSTINAGCGGEGVDGGLKRLERDVIRHDPDLVLIAYGLNDASSRGIEGLAFFSDALKELVRRVRQATGADVILLTPNMMLTKDNPAIPDKWRFAAPRLMETQGNGTLARYAQAIREAAADTGAAVADVYAAWERLAKEGLDMTSQLANGLNHPNRDMHWLPARLVMDQIAQ